MFASEIANGIPHDADAVEDGVERGVQHDDRERDEGRNPRRLQAEEAAIEQEHPQPLNTSPTENAARAPATTGVSSA